MSEKTENLGLIKAIHVGVQPPLNIKILWFDDNNGQKKHKYYNQQLSAWVPLSNAAEDISGSVGNYTYVAYAEDCNGLNFSLDKLTTSTNFALVVSDNPILQADLIASLFAGLWAPLCDGVNSGTSGSYTYVRYADDFEGANFDDKPVYQANVDPCVWADTFEVINKSGTINIQNVAEGVEITFDNVVVGNFINLRFKRSGIDIPNLDEKFFQIIQGVAFTAVGDPNDVRLNFNADVSNEIAYQYQNTPNSTTNFFQRVNNSNLRIEVPLHNGKAFSGSITLKIGDLSCESPTTTTEWKCRKYMAIVVSNEEITPENIIPSLFDGYYIPINCGGGSNSFDLTNLAFQIATLNDLLQSETNRINTEIGVLQTNISNLDQWATNSINTINSQITTMQTTLDTLNTTQGIMDLIQVSVNSLISQSLIPLQNDIDANELAIQDINTNKFVSSFIFPIIETAVQGLVDNFKNNYVDPQLSDLSGRIEYLESFHPPQPTV